MILVFAKPDFVQSRIDFMPDNNGKAKRLHMYKSKIFRFIYDVKNTSLGKSSNFCLYNMSNFWPKTKVTVELQVHSCKFKMKGKKKNIGYSFKLIRLYKLLEVKILLSSMLKKDKKRPTTS